MEFRVTDIKYGYEEGRELFTWQSMTVEHSGNITNLIYSS